MKINSPQPEYELGSSELFKKWELQHNAIERYTLAYFLPFLILRKLKIEPTSRKGTIFRFWFIVLLLLALPIIATTIENKWETAPVDLWILIAFVYGFASLSYSLYKAAGLHVCAFGYTVNDISAMKKQIQWDHKWFNMLSAFIPGIITSFALITTVSLMQSNSSEEIIATGTYFMIAVLGYQVGELTWNYSLVTVEAYRFSQMKHKLFPLRPADTVSLHKTLQGYNQIAALNSLFMTAFLGGLALLLPNQQYLTNPILLVVLILSYFVIGISIIVPRICVQRVVHTAKMKEMNSIQNLLKPLYGRIEDLSSIEFEQMKRLDEIHEIIQNSCENFLPFSTIGRVIGTFFLPTLTFLLAVASETYLQMLLEKIFQ